MDKNMIVITYPKIICFNFDLPKHVDDNLERNFEFITKSITQIFHFLSQKWLAENRIRNKTEELLLKYKHGYNIHNIH